MYFKGKVIRVRGVEEGLQPLFLKRIPLSNGEGPGKRDNKHISQFFISILVAPGDTHDYNFFGFIIYGIYNPALPHPDTP